MEPWAAIGAALIPWSPWLFVACLCGTSPCCLQLFFRGPPVQRSCLVATREGSLLNALEHPERSLGSLSCCLKQLTFLRQQATDRVACTTFVGSSSSGCSPSCSRRHRHFVRCWAPAAQTPPAAAHGAVGGTRRSCWEQHSPDLTAQTFARKRTCGFAAGPNACRLWPPRRLRRWRRRIPQ